MVDRKQLLAIVHIIKAEAGISDADYRDIMEARFKRRSAADLTPYQLSQLIDELKRKQGTAAPGGICHPCRPRPSHAVERPSDEVRWPVTTTQEQDIAQLRQNIHWGAPGGYLRWLMKYHKVLDVQDSRTAGRVIAGLRGLCMSQHHCRLCGEAGCISRLTSSPEGPRGPHVPESTLRSGDPAAPRHASKLTSAASDKGRGCS